jgi:UDP-N-acetylglucosamine--N-acetylmuramyl-(pentapeptide) pyrophosphoryl-undecaprenol N-acetylglucosamine transferase
MTKTIILSTGGTGGHIFPAQSVAKKLSQDGFKVVILGDKNYVKYHKPESFYKFHIINSCQLIKSPILLIKFFFKTSLAILQSLFWVLKYKPQVIVAFGGYATFPTLVSAIILKKRIILHEQNAHFGKVNRIFGRFANIIALSYSKTDGIKTNLSQKLRITGNPIREEIFALSKEKYVLPNFNSQSQSSDNLGYDVLLHSDFDHKEYMRVKPTFNILVLGGSGGAEIFSKILPQAFFNLQEKIKNNLCITQQCRANLLEDTHRQYKSFNINIVINSFFVDINSQIKLSHLIIARAGSSSIAEFSCAKKPMILVPFALSADNHQAKNAQQIEKFGGAIVIKEQDFSINKITSTLEQLINNPERLYKMSENAFKSSNLGATKNLIDLINCN